MAAISRSMTARTRATTHRLGEAAIREGGIVGGVDHPGVGPGAPHLGEHREAAEAGIEHEDHRARVIGARGAAGSAGHQIEPHGRF